MKKIYLLILIPLLCSSLFVQAQKSKKTEPAEKPSPEKQFNALKFRNIGPFRGGRTNAVCGVPGDPLTYYFGGVGGGIWKTEDAGISWRNISDGFLKSGSVGAIAIAPSDQNVIYAGMGEHAVRGVMTSHGDGLYKSTDAGQSWTHIGLEKSMHISSIIIHPQNPDMVYVAVQGALWGPSEDRGVYRSEDGGQTWKKCLFVDKHSGASDLSMDHNNPRILYAGMWDHQRYPWKIRSGGEHSGIWKSTDGGDNWERLSKGLPEEMGKVAVKVSPANSNRLYANIEAEKGGVYRSDNGGQSWQQVNNQRVTIARAWYYIELFCDPVNEDIVYVLNAPMLKSVDGGKSFQRIPNPHTDQHDLWINPANPKNMILGNDGGACITFNGGKSWSSQNNQPTAQFYRVIADQQFPYHIYGGQQDNSTVCIASKTRFGNISDEDWFPVAGGESAFLAFDPEDPEMVYGTSIQGFIDSYNTKSKIRKNIMAYPQLNLGTNPVDMKYRFNWNSPLVSQIQNPKILYHGGNLILRSDDEGYSWQEISPDLTRNDTSKHTIGGEPFTNEAAGGEVYNTISYLAVSPHQAGTIWVGTDDGLVHLTQNEGRDWQNVSPKALGEALINAVEVSPHDPATAYLAVTKYKFSDLSPIIYKTDNFGKSWKRIDKGLPEHNFVRVVREDPVRKGLLYAGTESGLWISFDDGKNWEAFQQNLPICPITDLTIADNDLVVATSGRAFWILDDLSILQQKGEQAPKDRISIFNPKQQYRFTTDASPKARGAGQNPMNGVIFDYILPDSTSEKDTLVLEVYDGKGSLIRSISNQKNTGFKSWEGGPQPDAVLPSVAGHNRFSWDLRRTALPAIENVFVMGDYRGHLSSPGKYTLKLCSNQDTVEVDFSLHADPRLKASAADFRAQQTSLLQIESTVKDIHKSVNRFRSVKKQLENRLILLREMEGKEEIVKKGETALENISQWEAKLIQTKQETFQDVINFRNQLSAELFQLKSMLDSHSPRPTKGTELRLKELLKNWETYKAEMEALIKQEIDGFNKAYQSSNLPALILPD